VIAEVTVNYMIGLVLGLLTLTTAGVGPSPASAGQTYACNGQPATIVIDVTNPDQQGTSGDDVVTILDGGHHFSAGAGADSVCTESGQNTIAGGVGDDFVSAGGFEPNVVRGGQGDDVILVSKGLARGQTTVKAGPGDDLVTATYGDHTIELGPGNDTAVLDEATNTTVLGGRGADTLQRVRPGEGIDSRILSASFFGNKGRDVLSYQAYSVVDDNNAPAVAINTATHKATGYGTITFHSVADFLGSEANDRFRGGAGTRVDRFWGLAGNDRMFGNGGNDFLYGGAGNDNADGGAGRDTCRAERRTSCERN